MTLSRRELFGMFRRRASGGRPVGEAPVTGVVPAPATVSALAAAPALAAAQAPFSLDGFYAGRTADRALPAFAIRATSTAATSQVGTGSSMPSRPALTPSSSASSAASAPAAATPIAPGLVPELLPHRCLATSSFCSVCSERCPVPGAIVTDRGRPRVVPDLCDGCGRCLAVCPAPILAFALVARSPRGPA